MRKGDTAGPGDAPGKNHFTAVAFADLHGAVVEQQRGDGYPDLVGRGLRIEPFELEVSVHRSEIEPLAVGRAAEQRIFVDRAVRPFVTDQIVA